MEEYKIIKKLEYLIAFQEECLEKGDWDGFDKSEMDIKKLEEILINNEKGRYVAENIKLRNILKSLETVSSYEN